MIKNIKYIIFILVLGVSPISNAQNLKIVLEKHFQAIGGLQKWQSIKNLKIVRTQKFVENESLVNTIYIIPDSTLWYESIVETGANHMIYCINGINGWRLNSPSIMQNQSKFLILDMDSEEIDFIKQQSSLLYGLENYNVPAYNFILEGNTVVDNQDNYEISMTSKKGLHIKYFINAKTFLLTKIIGDVSVLGMGMKVKSEVDFMGYKNIEGLMFPFEIGISSEKMSFGQQRIFHVESIKLNTNIDENLFKRPQ
jgi:hypothetical protein